MQKEFAQMLQQTTTGKLLEQITVRDFNLGSTFPIIRTVTTSGVHVDDDNMIEVSSTDFKSVCWCIHYIHTVDQNSVKPGLRVCKSEDSEPGPKPRYFRYFSIKP